MERKIRSETDIAVVLPARNEAGTIGESISRFHRSLPGAKIIVVDNGSSDSTQCIAQRTLNTNNIPGEVIAVNNVGKGHAIRRALCDVDAGIYLLCDADLTYPIEDAPRLIDPILNGHADMVSGNRVSNGAYYQQNRRRFHYVGNRLLTTLINVFFNRRFNDALTGFRALSHTFAKHYPANANGFDAETDITIHAAVSGARVLEIPIAYCNRPLGSHSKLHTLRDGLLCFKTILVKFLKLKLLRRNAVNSAQLR